MMLLSTGQKDGHKIMWCQFRQLSTRIEILLQFIKTKETLDPHKYAVKTWNIKPVYKVIMIEAGL